MSHKIKIDKATDTTIQPFFVILLASLLVFGILGFMLSHLPYYSISYLYVATLLSSAGIIFSIWLNQKPNLWAKFFKFLSLSGLLTLTALRFFIYLSPTSSEIIKTLIISSVFATNLLPVLSLAKTRFIKGELFSPKTRVGKVVLRLSLALLSIAGAIGASFGLFNNRLDNTKKHGICNSIGYALLVISTYHTFLNTISNVTMGE